MTPAVVRRATVRGRSSRSCCSAWRPWRWAYALGVAPRAPARRAPSAGYGRAGAVRRGLLVVLAALVSPLDSLGDQLMVLHMVQHMLLLDIAPILLILGLTKGLLRPVTRRVHTLERRAGLRPPRVRGDRLRRAAVAVAHPAHVRPGPGQRGLHVLEHLCFAAAGSLYWWHLLSPIRSRMRLGGLGPIGYMVSQAARRLLGVALAFAPTRSTPSTRHKPAYWGLTAHFDQSMAGLVMALEQSIVMGIALVYLFVRMLSESEREAERAERYEFAESAGAARLGRTQAVRRGATVRRRATSSAAPIAPPRSPSAARAPPGGWASLNRWGSIAVSMRSGHRLAEAHAQAAADDHGLDVEQVDRRGDAGAERLDRLVDELGGQLVLVLERPLPRSRWSGAGGSRFSMILNRSVCSPSAWRLRARASIAARPA